MMINQRSQLAVIMTIVGVLVFGVGYFVARAESRADTRVIYSLDKRQNDRELIKLIDNANKYVYFAIYYFSEKDIADALVRAKKRGLVVWGITDRDADQDVNKDVVSELQNAGITVESQRHLDGIMHIKALVTDQAYASGSYNWTEAATDANDEILEIGSDENARKQYLSIIQKILEINH